MNRYTRAGARQCLALSRPGMRAGWKRHKTGPEMTKGARGAPFLPVPMERAMRFELTTLTLARLCSTPELRPRRLDRR